MFVVACTVQGFFDVNVEFGYGCSSNPVLLNQILRLGECSLLEKH